MVFKLIVFVCATLAILFSFQNCGKAGFDSTEEGSESISGIDPKLNDAPFALDVSINQFAKMNCPVTGFDTYSIDGNLSRPYFTLRFGAFDALPGFSYDTATAVPAQIDAGIKLSTAAYNYMNSRMGGANPENVARLLKTSPVMYNKSLVAGMIYRNRNSATLSGTQVGVEMLEPFSNDAMVSAFTKAANPFTTKINFFGGNSLRQAMLGSVYKSLNSADVTAFQDLLPTHYIHLGFVDSSQLGSAGNVIRGFAGPTGKPWETLYGKSYSVVLDPSSQPGNNDLIYTMKEFDLSQNAGGVEVASAWKCFDYTVVRDIDRRRCIDAGGNPVPKKNEAAYNCSNYFNNYAEMQVYENAAYVIPGANQPYGIYEVCPPQPLATVNLVELQYLRRFLPAEQFEINTYYKCIVAKPNVRATTQCYDFATESAHDRFIIYDGSKPCGGTGNQCPAKMTMCVRNQ